MNQPDPAEVCTHVDDCGCSAETRAVIPGERTPVPTEESERIVPAQTTDLQNMRSPVAGDQDVNPPISAINPAEFRPVDLSLGLREEVYDLPGEESEETTGRKTQTSPDALLLLFPAGTTADLPDVPDEERRCEPDDEDHPTRVRAVPGW